MDRKAEIFITDDHPLMIEGMRKVLSVLDDVQLVVSATSGREAKNWIEKRDFDIYIFDVSMPDISGFELVELVRELNPDACIVIYTMHEEIWYISRLLQLRVNAIVLKASDMSELVKAVKAVLKGDCYTCDRFRKIHRKLVPASVVFHPNDMPTKREIEVLQAVADGCSTPEIAERLAISENTVETFRKRLIQKFNAKNSVDMVVRAIERGCINVKKQD